MQTQKYIEKTLKNLLLKNCIDASIVIYDNVDCDPGNLGPKRVSNIEVKDNKINQLMHLIMLKNVGTIFNTIFLHCQILRHKRISCEFSIF